MSNQTLIKITKSYKKIDAISNAKSIYALTLEVEHYKGKCIRVIELDSGTELDIGFLKNGKLDLPALLAHTGTDEGYIVKWYDQKEFSDAIATNQINKPKIVSGGVVETENGEPCIIFDNANDVLLSDIQYANNEQVVSILSRYTSPNTSEADAIISTNPISTGILKYHNASRSLRLRTNRIAGNSEVIGNVNNIGINNSLVIANRANIKIYQDGEFTASANDLNSDFKNGTSLAIGARGNSSLASASKFQFVGVWLSDESNNAQELHDELNYRYNNTISNPKDTVWFSDKPVYFSSIIGYSSDTYAHGRISGDINFSESLTVFPWTNSVQSGFGNIDITNNDSKFNNIVTDDYNNIYIYKYTNGVINEFGNGEISNIGYIENGRIRIVIKPALDKLNVELPTKRFDSTYPDLENEKKQLCLGRVNLPNIRLLDVATNRYFVSDNLFGLHTVFDNGISVDFTPTSDGFILNQQPVGKILPIVFGLSNGTGSYQQYLYQHIQRLLADIDIDFSQSDLSLIYNTMPCTWSGTSETVLGAIQELLNGFMSFIYTDIDGKLRFGKLSLPINPTDTLIENEIIGDVKAFKDTAQGLSNVLKNSRNYNPYSEDEIAFGATQANKINLIKDYKRTSILFGLHPFYQNHNVEMVSQSLGGIPNGKIILQYIIDLWSEVRYFYDVSTIKEFSLNQVINITHDLKGLENGKDVVVISKSINTKTQKINYKLWG